MNIIFCGTPQFAVPTLRAMVESGFSVKLVVTQPDRPRGRGMQLSASPVKRLATEVGLPVLQPDKIKNNIEFRTELESIRPDAVVVVGYGRIIPQWMIDLPPLGNINLHASLLPKYRGAAPIQWAIAKGETITGVSIMRIDAGLDTGDIVAQRELGIAPDDTFETLAPRLADIGAKLMVETLPAWQQGRIEAYVQDHSQASLAPILKKEDGLMDFRRTAAELYNRLRGFQPWPGAYTSFRGKSLHVWKARPLASVDGAIDPGTLKVRRDELLVGCGELSVLEFLELQPEGKRCMSARDFINGYRPKTGERLGSY